MTGATVLLRRFRSPKRRASRAVGCRRGKRGFHCNHGQRYCDFLSDWTQRFLKARSHTWSGNSSGAARIAKRRKVSSRCVRSNCRSVEFFVSPAKPNSLTFLVHPSRAPVGEDDVISGVALPFDQFHNMVFTPTTLTFS